MPAQMTEFHVTGLDIDGNGSRLREWDAFMADLLIHSKIIHN